MEEKLLIRLYKYIFHFRLIFCSNSFIPFLITSPVVAIAFIHSRPRRPRSSRFVQFIETNHSSCPCKQYSYFHSCSPSNPVWQTTASDHKHTCTLTCTGAHSGNKSPTFLWLLSLKPMHQGFILCFFSSLYMHLFKFIHLPIMLFHHKCVLYKYIYKYMSSEMPHFSPCTAQWNQTAIKKEGKKGSSVGYSGQVGSRKIFS